MYIECMQFSVQQQFEHIQVHGAVVKPTQLKRKHCDTWNHAWHDSMATLEVSSTPSQNRGDNRHHELSLRVELFGCSRGIIRRYMGRKELAFLSLDCRSAIEFGFEYWFRWGVPRVLWSWKRREANYRIDTYLWTSLVTDHAAKATLNYVGTLHLCRFSRLALLFLRNLQIESSLSEYH